MRTKVRVILVIVSLVTAIGLFLFGSFQFQSLVATRTFVVPAVYIQPYVLITTEMLQTRELAATMASENVYMTADEVVGCIATMTLAPGQLIYRHQAVAPRAFRYVDDPSLEIISFPVDPARAVGGQIHVGQRVNIYRVALGNAPATQLPAAAMLAEHGAESELLVPGAWVVDIRSARGEAVGRPVGSQWETQAREGSSVVPLNILTVAVSPTVALNLVRLAGESQGRYDIWVTLAPLTPTVVITSTVTVASPTGPATP